MLLDQQKAFDSVSRLYMEKVLEAMNFGPNFRRWVSLIYHQAESMLKINNTLSDPVAIEQGVRQGDALPFLLFVILAINP